MKGVLSAICAFALVGLATSTFPNDMYYHHHPHLAVAEGRGGGSIRHAQQQGHSRDGNRNHYHHNTPHHNAPHRNNNHHDGGRHRSAYGHRNNYGHYKRAYDDNEQSNIVYTAEGGIDWSKSKVSKVADNADNDEQHTSRNTGPNQYQRNQRHPFDEEEDDYDHQYSNRRYDQQSRYDRYNTYDDDDYYDDDYYEENYRGRSGRESSHYNRYDSYDDGDNYASGGDDSYDSNTDNSDRDLTNKQAYTSGRNAYTTPSTDSVPFTNGIRLAGTLPDDGYNRGQGTFYDLETHVGTCGKQNKNTEFVVALNAEQMGEGNSKNEKCNKEVEITGPSGKTVRATVVDSCKTCAKGGLDLSPAAFEEIGEFSQGSIPIKWKYV